MAGGDHALAVEQGGAGQDDGDADGHLAHGGVVAALQGEQGEDATLAVVVGASDEGKVLHADHEHEGPEDQGEHAEHAGGAVVCRQMLETLAQRVERARPDIAEDHAERPQGEGSAGLGGKRRGGGLTHPERAVWSQWRRRQVVSAGGAAAGCWPT